jgi:hypothetical protein
MIPELGEKQVLSTGRGAAPATLSSRTESKSGIEGDFGTVIIKTSPDASAVPQHQTEINSPTTEQ